MTDLTLRRAPELLRETVLEFDAQRGIKRYSGGRLRERDHPRSAALLSAQLGHATPYK